MKEEKTIPEMLSTILQYHAWSQQELAARFKVADSQVSRWLSGAQKPQVDSYRKIISSYEQIPERFA